MSTSWDLPQTISAVGPRASNARTFREWRRIACIYLNVSVYVSMFACLFACLYVCVYVCMYVSK